MTRVFSLLRVQQDDQIDRQDPQAVGELVIDPHDLDLEGWNGGFVTEYPDSD